ncbi:MAG: TetR/AcrR family transcriptional regulator [Proteobacteria bacterium]|nr:TetR/AcrR family transcriptional regulator [Pseudomonadota bacterium]MBU4472160.1 TetR/AcrR family transcriptional regulator [Pseudomonadota bacterium]MCG2753828.1 TetR/AcrR family transcriptional regulator [Desulfobacteraceae bacterium]
MAGKQESRKKREKDQRKQEVLFIALGLFSERGVRNVSMQEIADKAEYSVGTLYNLFAGKEAMFDELFENCSSQVKEAFLTVLEGPGTEPERLSLFIKSMPDILEEHAEFIRLYVAETGQRPGNVSQPKNIDDLKSTLNIALLAIIGDGIQKGLFRHVDPHIAAKAIGALLETLAFEITEPFNKSEMMEVFAKVEHLFLKGLLLPGGHRS